MRTRVYRIFLPSGYLVTSSFRRSCCEPQYSHCIVDYGLTPDTRHQRQGRICGCWLYYSPPWNFGYTSTKHNDILQHNTKPVFKREIRMRIIGSIISKPMGFFVRELKSSKAFMNIYESLQYDEVYADMFGNIQEHNRMLADRVRI